MSTMASQITSLGIVLLNRLFGGRSKKTSKLHVTDLCVWNLPATGEFHAQKASYAGSFFPYDDVFMYLCYPC